MFLVWILALLLAIPTYGISLIVVFIIGALNMQKNENNIKSEIGFLASEVIDNYKKHRNYHTRLSDDQILNLVSKYYEEIMIKLQVFRFTDKDRSVLATVTTYGILEMYYEKYDFITAESMASKMLADWFIELKNKGHLGMF